MGTRLIVGPVICDTPSTAAVRPLFTAPNPTSSVPVWCDNRMAHAALKRSALVMPKGGRRSSVSGDSTVDTGFGRNRGAVCVRGGYGVGLTSDAYCLQNCCS